MSTHREVRAKEKRAELYDPMFDALRAHNTYMWNLGSWTPTTSTLHEAQCNLVDRCLLAMQPGAEQRILDVGCGIGGVSAYMATRAPTCRFVGITNRAADVARAAEVLGELNAALAVSVQHGDAHHLPFPDGSFDHVLCLESATEYHDKPLFLAEAFRVLAPGGRLVLADVLFRNDRLVLDAGQRVANRLFEVHFCSSGQWERTIAESPFRRASSYLDLTPNACPPADPRARWSLGDLLRPSKEPARALWRMIRWGILQYGLWVLERPSGLSR